MAKTKTKILDTNHITQKLNRMAYEVYEKNYSEKELLLVGIEGNGYKVADRLAEILKKISPLKIKLSKIKMDKENPWAADPKNGCRCPPNCRSRSGSTSAILPRPI